MAIYPENFLMDQVISRYECSKKIVVWQAFRDTLSNLFAYYHKPLKHAGVWYLCQCRSISEGHNNLDPNDHPNENSGNICGFTWIDTAHLIEDFHLVNVASCNEDGSTNESPETRLWREIYFFIPILIWYFNKAKKQLDNVDKEVIDLRTHLHRDKVARSILLKVPEDELSAPETPMTGDRFLVSTAMKLRKSPAWAEYVSQEQARSPFEQVPLPGSPGKDGGKHTEISPQSDPNSFPNIGLLSGDLGTLVSSHSDLVISLLMRCSFLDSSERESGSATRDKEEAAMFWLVHALEAQIEQTNVDLKAKILKRDECNAKFAALQVCFSVFFNKHYMSLVYRGDFIMQVFLEDYKKNPQGLDANTPRTFAEQITEVINRNGALPVDLPSTIVGLSEVLHSRNDYFDQEALTVETSIDSYINKLVPHEASFTHSPTDLRVLLTYLDSL